MLLPLTEADIPEIMRIERGPGYESLVGRWSAEEHAAELKSPAARYFTWREGGRTAGFVMLQEFTDPVVLLRRIAVAAPGAGTGTRLLRAVVDWVFETSPAEAIDLHVRPENARAKTVYHREGFVPNGDGDELHEVLILAREAWAALPRRAA